MFLLFQGAETFTHTHTHDPACSFSHYIPLGGWYDVTVSLIGVAFYSKCLPTHQMPMWEAGDDGGSVWEGFPSFYSGALSGRDLCDSVWW